MPGGWLEAVEVISGEDEEESDGGDGYFADGSYEEGAGALFEEVFEVGAQAHSAKVRRNAQRLRLPRARSWGLAKA